MFVSAAVRNDGSTRPIEVTADEYSERTTQLVQLCDAWLRVNISNEAFAEKSTALAERSIAVQGFCHKDDDFDWRTIPPQQLENIDDLWRAFENALSVKAAIDQAIMEKATHFLATPDTTLLRATLYGKYANNGKAMRGQVREACRRWQPS